MYVKYVVCHNFRLTALSPGNLFTRLFGKGNVINGQNFFAKLFIDTNEFKLYILGKYKYYYFETVILNYLSTGQNLKFAKGFFTLCCRKLLIELITKNKMAKLGISDMTT